MRQEASQSVFYEIHGAVGLIALCNAPVNAASYHLRQGIAESLRALNASGVQAIAIYGETRAFIAGADISEFGKEPVLPMLPEVCQIIEDSETPVVAILHGATLGGGLEVAIASHARIALPNLVTGFPEVTLGVLPGAGGTQRGPRLIGLRATLDLATSGRRIGAQEALDIGLVDRIADGAPRDIALQYGAELAAGTLPARKTGALTVVADDDAITEYTDRLAKKQAHLFAPHKVVESVSNATGPLAAGLASERALFAECIDSPQRAGLIHAFFAERAVGKFPEQDAPARQIDSIGVIGGGTMGSGIATAALLAGLRVILAERDAEALQRGQDTIAKNLEGAVKRGKLSADKRDAILAGALKATTELADFADVDLVIEAVFEDMQVKKDIFGQLDHICKPGAILASNTSYLDINEIAAATARPQDVIGLHFFSPAHVMRLLEVVVADKTAPDVTASGFALAKKLRKIAVRAGVCDGFIGNRILAHYRKAADYMMADGASPKQIDDAITGFGFAMGPFAVSDLAGLDIGWATRKRKAPTRDPVERYVSVADRICENGWFGRKSGKGFYLYGDAAKGGALVPNPEIDKILEAERTAEGATLRDFTDEDIVNRYMTAMVVEAVRVLADGIALRPVDIDAVFLFGYGFPRHHGGPMHYADSIGIDTLINRIEDYASEDSYYWRVPIYLREMAANGTRFADLNTAPRDS